MYLEKLECSNPRKEQFEETRPTSLLVAPDGRPFYNTCVASRPFSSDLQICLLVVPSVSKALESVAR